MTRFTRAVGSKSSNKRVPEDATPWNQLKHASKNPSSTKRITWKKTESSTIDVDSSKMGESYFPDSVVIDESPDADPMKMEESHKIKSKKEYKRRKPLTNIPSLFKDGQEVNIVRFEGFPVRKHDAERLKELKKKMLQSKIPLTEVKKTLKLERRRAEKALAREKKKLCFHCRNSGHILSECPELDKNSEQLPESGICFKCGSTEHQHTQCKAVRGDRYNYATCFVCKEAGHISKQCPDNPRGLYPDGGSCNMCGDVTHLKKDCPKFSKRRTEEFELTVNTLNTEAPDALDEDLCPKEKIIKSSKKKKKIVKM